MENMHHSRNKLSFYGEGGQLFGIQIINLLLTTVTLGLYYPWAKAAYLKYLYQHIELEGSRFAFEGTGKEMFIGFIKAVLVIVLLYALLFGAALAQDPGLYLLTWLVIMVAGMLLYPVAIHGSLRYRLARTTWRGIYFGYRGQLKELVQLFAKGVFLTFITFGIYGSWFVISVRNYAIKHIRFGNVSFEYVGEGSEFFVLNIKGYFLTLLTFGIYAFWWQKDLFNYWVENLRVRQGDKVITLQSTATGGSMFSLLAVNLLIVVFTLGLGAPWATIRTFRYLFEHTSFSEPIDTTTILQTEDEYHNATGDELGDMMDIGILDI